jgi:hypothetical protein
MFSAPMTASVTTAVLKRRDHHMSDFHFHLPDWPPQRLLDEAVMSYTFRHLDEPPLDPTTSPWPLLRRAILAFLRHQTSNYEERLSGEFNKELRDELATALARSAHLKYPWLGKDDPRPFPPAEDDSPSKPFNELARDLAHDHGVRNHLTSAIRDLKRQGDKQLWIKVLQESLVKTEQRIQRDFSMLAGPKHLQDAAGGSSCGYRFPHLPEKMDRYDFCDGRTITPNRYDFLGFCCSQCRARVAKLKQPIDFGQGWRVLVYSCFCKTVAIACPPVGKHLKPLTLEDWNFGEEK